MRKNSSDKAYEDISNVIYQAVLNPHLDKEMPVSYTHLTLPTTPYV